MFSPDIHCIVVVGAQWGDEGKGKVVDVLAERAELVVRYQGGANAGHTVDAPGGEFVLHQIPAGILHPGTRCVIGNGVVLDPETLFHEIDALVERGVVDRRAPDGQRPRAPRPAVPQAARHARAPRSRKIGTTGRGIGPAYEDKIGRRGVRVGDLRHPAIVRASWSRRGASAPTRCWRSLGAPKRCDRRRHVERMLGRSGAAPPAVRGRCRASWCGETLASGGDVLLEGAQGALLDVDHGTYPFVTSSNTTAGGAAVGAGIGPTAIDAVLGVVKAYTTRVGNGPLPTEATPEPPERTPPIWATSSARRPGGRGAAAGSTRSSCATRCG